MDILAGLDPTDAELHIYATRVRIPATDSRSHGMLPPTPHHPTLTGAATDELYAQLTAGIAYAHACGVRPRPTVMAT